MALRWRLQILYAQLSQRGEVECPRRDLEAGSGGAQLQGRWATHSAKYGLPLSGSGAEIVPQPAETQAAAAPTTPPTVPRWPNEPDTVEDRRAIFWSDVAPTRRMSMEKLVNTDVPPATLLTPRTY